ncbi:MAG TPA: Holliday junction branch migration protein RuvA [Trueperaceae bacterium]|nr:Holliday junction branch migration protein RuvA [Trueperaceae bacterium]
MIAFLDGQVAEISEVSVTLAVGGVGLEVLAPSSTLARCAVGETIHLRTQLIVRDEQPSLYGFHMNEQLQLFRRLLEVGGIGPKLALALLSHLQVPLIVTAVVNADPGLLTSAPGVGKRTAERIVVALKGLLSDELLALGAGGAASGMKGAGEDAAAALLALGYRESQVRGVVAELVAQGPDDPAEALIRKALGRLR